MEKVVEMWAFVDLKYKKKISTGTRTCLLFDLVGRAGLEKIHANNLCIEREGESSQKIILKLPNSIKNIMCFHYSYSLWSSFSFFIYFVFVFFFLVLSPTFFHNTMGYPWTFHVPLNHCKTIFSQFNINLDRKRSRSKRFFMLNFFSFRQVKSTESC
jgi:hypothetical protein